jgi:hypothetical protein
MKKQILLLLALFIAVSQFWGCSEDQNIWGQINGSGNIVDVNYSISDFSKIDISHAFAVTLVQSDTFYVKIKVDDNLARYLDVYKSGSWLMVGLDGDHNYNNTHLTAEIHLPDITEFKGSGAIVAEMETFDLAHDFSLDLSGASVFSGNFDTADLDLDLSGASVVNITGTGENLNINASGASSINMGNFICKNADVVLSGATFATIHPTEMLNAEVSGASTLNYYGNPALGSINISGASVIHKL